MQKGIETRYIIHEILKILKTRPIGLDKIFAEKVEREIIIPTIKGLVEEDIDYKGFIFIGLMVENGSPKVIRI